MAGSGALEFEVVGKAVPAETTRALSLPFEIPYSHTESPRPRSAFGRLVPEKLLDLPCVVVG